MPIKELCWDIRWEPEEAEYRAYFCQLPKGHSGTHDSNPDNDKEGLRWKDMAKFSAAIFWPEWQESKEGQDSYAKYWPDEISEIATKFAEAYLRVYFGRWFVDEKRIL